MNDLSISEINRFCADHHLYQDSKSNSLAFYGKNGIMNFRSQTIDDLKKLVISAKKPARICLHQSKQDDLHNMIICMTPQIYYPPHMHDEKAELYQIISGRIAVVFFDVKGHIIRLAEMSADNQPIVRVEPRIFHFLLPLDNAVVFCESRNGPFLEGGDSLIADWAPGKDDTAGIAEFIANIDTYLKEKF